MNSFTLLSNNGSANQWEVLSCWGFFVCLYVRMLVRRVLLSALAIKHKYNSRGNGFNSLDN